MRWGECFCAAPACLEGRWPLWTPRRAGIEPKRILAPEGLGRGLSLYRLPPLPFLPLGWECLSCVGAAPELRKHVTRLVPQARSRRGLCLWMSRSLSHPHGASGRGTWTLGGQGAAVAP